MSNRKKIIVDLLRHGEPEGGDILRGRVDPILTNLGWEQMQQAAALTSKQAISPLTPKWTHVVSSPLQRCKHFAELVSDRFGYELNESENWLEIDYGDWDGLPIEQWRELAADQFREFRKDMSKLAPPGGEDFISFKDRILAAWKDLAELDNDSHVLVVTHGGVMRVVLPSVLGMPLNRSFPLHIPFACLSRIRLDVVEEGNDKKVSASLLFHNGAEYVTG
ncbi:MAG: histidine phosphatase family protein [Gammaproteobacteria bacterium]|nr:histidine phosphatase family protein [Gammaproteobacteria bacterium]MBT3859315.1 histidine phosphatase family protein [Gammaproteobacteria bacterium]MBT3988005.1 histidine phosphatase family protein [Gammaproteobacteria bacterium]MBT4583094.1 histidine phosphatase family protein [Gammaproteobacteria bacterium]MBT4658059.1 histidine phosphatase family protein [Gammaproteobacteria bacterium]